MSRENMLLMCSHFSPFMCQKCAKCRACCECPPPVPGLVSTMSLAAQERIRELDRVRKEEYGRHVKPS